MSCSRCATSWSPCRCCSSSSRGSSPGGSESPRPATSRQRRHRAHPACSAWSTSRLNDGNPRLYDFRGAIEEVRADAGPQEPACSTSLPTCATCSSTTRPSCSSRPLRQGLPRRGEGSPVFVVASFQDNKLFFDRTNKVVGQLDFLAAQVACGALPNKCAQTHEVVGVPMSSRPWDVRLRKVTWQPVPRADRACATRVRIMALLGLPFAVWYFGWLLNPDRIGDPYLYGHPDRGRALQPHPGASASGGRARTSACAKPKAPSEWLAVDVFVPVYKEPVDIVDLTVAAAAGPARRRGPRLGARRRQRRRHARPRRAPRRGLHPPRRAHRREGGEHQQRPRHDLRAVHRGLRLRPRGRPHLPRGHARAHGRPEDRVRADPAVLRQRARRSRIAGGVLGAAGAVLRRDRPRQGRARRRLLLRHQRALPPRGVRERRWLSHQLADRGLRALDPPPREGLEVGLRAGRAVARARAGGHGGLRLPAAALGPGLPVGRYRARCERASRCG